MPLDRATVEQLVREDLGLDGEPGALAVTFQGGTLVFEHLADDSEANADAPVLAAMFPNGSGGTREQYAVRWRFSGQHLQTRSSTDVNNPMGPTGNLVEFTGVTIVQVEDGKETLFMRYVDWLSAYSQMGLVELRRPSVVDFQRNGERVPAVIGYPKPGDELPEIVPTGLPDLPIENDLPIY